MVEKRKIVIIPTYNEADNIERLITALFGLKLDIDILVVDDDSPDGTSTAVRNAFRTNPNVFLITRAQKDGRGGAVFEGIKFALKTGVYDKIIEMDADFSHDPKDLPALIEKSNEVHVAVGSRYLPKSRIVNWPLSRRIFSRLANLFAGMMLKVPITDYTNGYRCYSLDAAISLDPSSIRSKGYIVLSEIAFRLYKNGFTFGEIPILFVNRQKGNSNFNLNEVFDSLKCIWNLRFGKSSK